MNSKYQHKTWLLLLLTAILSQSCGPVTLVAPTIEATEIGVTAEMPPATETAVLSPTPPAPSENSIAQIGKIDLSQMNVDEWASTSPDGGWVATGLVAFSNQNAGEQLAYVRLLIFSADGKTLWKIIEERQEIGLGFPYPTPLKWSQDGHYFYFSHRVVPDGCSVFETLSDLQRADLRDGSVEQLLPHAGLGLALSPDEAKVAYLAYGDRGLVVRDLTTGAERDIRIDPGEDFQAGNIVWSPENKSLTLTLAIRPCSGTYPSKTVWAAATSILLINMETLEQKVLIQEDPRLFVTVEWKEPNRIVITDGTENSLWYLNVNSGEITRE